MQPDNRTINERYDYSRAGFGNFLTRSLDDHGQGSLNVPINVQSRALALDRRSMSGALGDIYRIGDLHLNGPDGKISLMVDGGELFALGNLEYGPGLTISDENFPRLLAGTAQGGDVKIKLSKQGFDVNTATDEQLIWSSDFNNFKIVGESEPGTQAPAITTVADGTNTYSGFNTNAYPHGLNFTPLIMAFVEVSPTQYSLMPYSEVKSANDPMGGLTSEVIRVTANSVSVEVFHYFVSYSPGILASNIAAKNVKYFLLRETAATDT